MISIALLRTCSQEVSESVSGIPKLLQLVSTGAQVLLYQEIITSL